MEQLGEAITAWNKKENTKIYFINEQLKKEHHAMDEFDNAKVPVQVLHALFISQNYVILSQYRAINRLIDVATPILFSMKVTDLQTLMHRRGPRLGCIY